MGKTTLTWDYDGLVGDGFKIYRADSPMDPENLPPPMATVGIGVREYVDETVIDDGTYYYRIGSYIGGTERLSEEIEHIAEDAGDPHWDNVVALLHFDEDLADETGRVWIPRGGALSSSDQDKFGGGSMHVPSGSRGGLYHPASPDFALSQADYTIEMFVFPVGSGPKWFLEIGGGSWTTRFWIDRWEEKLRVAGGPAISTWIHNGIIPDNEWTHIAVTIEGGVLRAFINGIISGSASITGQIPTGNLHAGVGHTLPATATFSAQFTDELRITKGVARYTEDFTPPTEPFPNFGPPVRFDPHWDNVVALLHFDEDLTDETGRVWESVGSSVVSSDESVFGGSSLKVPTTSGLVRAADSADFDFGSGDFTIEFFLRPTSVTSWASYLDKRASGSFHAPFAIQRDGNSGNIRFSSAYAPGSWPVVITAAHPPLNMWTHVVYERRGGIFLAFINGVQVGAVDGGSNSLLTNTAALNIAATGNNMDGMAGYIDELRITKGVARYIKNFTPPTEPFHNF